MAPERLEQLTQRERQILSLMADGWANDVICSELGIGPKTVESHIRSIFLKLDLPPDGTKHRRVAAVVTFLEGQRQRVKRSSAAFSIAAFLLDFAV
jgi:DNA-binding NarL/FixJ family response regulator